MNAMSIAAELRSDPSSVRRLREPKARPGGLACIEPMLPVVDLRDGARLDAARLLLGPTSALLRIEGPKVRRVIEALFPVAPRLPDLPGLFVVDEMRTDRVYRLGYVLDRPVRTGRTSGTFASEGTSDRERLAAGARAVVAALEAAARRIERPGTGHADGAGRRGPCA